MAGYVLFWIIFNPKKLRTAALIDENNVKTFEQIKGEFVAFLIGCGRVWLRPVSAASGVPPLDLQRD